MDNCGCLLYSLAYGMLSILRVVLPVLPQLREYGQCGLFSQVLYAAYGPVAGREVAVKYSYAPSTSAYESLPA
jgi:hypothetical protein